MSKRGERFRRMRKHSNKRTIRSSDTKFEVCSWNVEQKGSAVEIDKCVIAALQERPDVICLQQAIPPPSDTDTNNFKWLCKAKTGSAIVLRKLSKLTVHSFEQFCDQICMAVISGTDGVKMYVINCYIPPATEYVAEDLWVKLKEIIGSIPPNSLFLLAGDFNAHVGKDDMTFTAQFDVIKRRMHHEISNENGKKLIDLIRKCHLKMFVAQKKIGKECYTYDNGKTKSQQSFIFFPLLRDAFTGDGYTIWHPRYHHALIRFSLIYSPNQLFNWEVTTKADGSTNKPAQVVINWNIQNATPTKIDTLMNDYKFPIVCIQELFLTSDEDIQSDNYTWLSSKRLWAKNVGILIKKCSDITVSAFEPLSEYLCAATLMVNGEIMIVISFCLPSSSDTQQEKTITQLKELIKGLPGGVMVVLGGDFSSAAEKCPDREIMIADNFVTDLAKETKMELSEHASKKNIFPIVTQVSDTGKYRNQYILISEGVKESTQQVAVFNKWIPHFEYALTCLIIKGKEEKFTFEVLNVLDMPISESRPFEGDTSDGVAIHIGTYKSKKDISLREDIETLVSVEDVEKYKDNPPSAEDLGRMLKDLVLLQLPTRRGVITSTSFNLLVKSLCESNFGELMKEEITDTKENRKICKLKWRGVLLAEEIGGADEEWFNLKNKAVDSVIAKLSQTCYTVKAKKSYFNKGKAPLLMKMGKPTQAFKKVSKSSYPKLEDLYKYINEFMAEDTDNELIFGADYSIEELFDIATYIFKTSDLMDFRFFKSSNSKDKPDNLALFRKRTPQQLRDSLIKNPEHPKYYLIHPCGLGGDYIEFATRFCANIIQEEDALFKLFSNQSNTTRTSPRKPRESSTGGRKRDFNTMNASQNGSTKKIQPFSSSGRKRDYNTMNAGQNGSTHKIQPFSPSYDSKRAREDFSFKVSLPNWQDIRPLLIVWPINIRSQMEEQPEQVLSDNFTMEIQTRQLQNDNVSAVFVAMTNNNGIAKTYCIARGSSPRNAARVALQVLINQCTIIKPNPNYLCNGGTPNFIRYKQPCEMTPRTYLILDKQETGYLSWQVIEKLMERFLNSYEEEVFFDRICYTYAEKLALIETIPKLAPSKLKVRHFGDSPKLVDRYVSVYKIKSQQDILQEVLKMRNQHPKFIMTANRLPREVLASRY